MMKKVLYFATGATGLLLVAYFLQPLKRGRGLNASLRYEWVKDWLRLPDSVHLGNPTGIGLDTAGNLVVFQRAGREWPLLGALPNDPIPDKTVLIIDRVKGTLITGWGDHFFMMPHGLTVDRENNVWVTDVGLQQVFKFTHEGKLLLQVGEASKAGCDSTHFDKPTAVAVTDDGSFYVSDGYGNNRIVKFSAAGKFLFAWGRKGSKEGEFNLPHGLALDGRGNLYVADRENNRIQVFDSAGKFRRQFSDNSFGAVCGVAVDETGGKIFAVDDVTFLKIKHRGSDAFVFDTVGRVQTRFGRSGFYNGPAAWYHALATDADEAVYVGDILGNTIQKFKKVSGR